MEEDVDNGIIHQEERKKYSEAEEETLSFEYRIEELGRKFSILPYGLESEDATPLLVKLVAYFFNARLEDKIYLIKEIDELVNQMKLFVKYEFKKLNELEELLD